MTAFADLSGKRARRRPPSDIRDVDRQGARAPRRIGTHARQRLRRVAGRRSRSLSGLGRRGGRPSIERRPGCEPKAGRESRDPQAGRSQPDLGSAPELPFTRPRGRPSRLRQAPHRTAPPGEGSPPQPVDRRSCRASSMRMSRPSRQATGHRQRFAGPIQPAPIQGARLLGTGRVLKLAAVGGRGHGFDALDHPRVTHRYATADAWSRRTRRSRDRRDATRLRGVAGD